MAQPRFWSLRMFAALWGVLLAPLAPTLGGMQETVQSASSNHLLYCGWSHLIDENGAKYLRAIPAVARLTELEPEILEQLNLFADVVALLGGASGELTVSRIHVIPPDHTPLVDFHGQVDLGDKLPRMSSFLQSLIESEGAAELEQADVAGCQFNWFKRTPYLRWALNSGKFLAASSPEEAKKAFEAQAGDAGQSKELARNLERIRTKLHRDPKSPWHFELYVDFASVLANVHAVLSQGNALPPNFDQALTELGVDGLRSISVVCDESDGLPASRTLIETDGSAKGILRLWEQRPLERADLELLPASTSWGTVCSLNLAELWTETHRVVEALDPEAALQLDGAIGMSAGLLGFNVVEQVLPAFGDTWVLYDAPENGGYYFSGMVMIAEVTQPEALNAAFSRLLQIARPFLVQKGFDFALGHVEYEGHDIQYLTIPGLPIPIAPAATYIDGRLICGLSPQAVKMAVRQADPKLRKGSILDHPDVRRYAGDPSGKVTQFSFVDMKTRATQGYPIMQLIRIVVSTLLAREDGIEALGVLPTYPEVVDRTTSYVATCSPRGADVVYEEKGSMFSADALVGFFPIFSYALMISILLPSLSRARALAKRAVSASNLQNIGTACHIFANDHDEKFPPDLDALIQAGLISQETLVSPRHERSGVSYVYIEGQTEAADARNILVYERVIDGEGTNALFIDGHVEWMKLPAFEDALRKTYERLGRPMKAPVGDIPEVEYQEESPE